MLISAKSLLWPSLGLMVLLLASCDLASTLGPRAGSAAKSELRVKFNSGSCYGRCEVFTLELYENGLLLFKGKRFTDRPGVWQKSIDRRRTVALIDSFERADFENYPLSFRGQIPDAPTLEITYYGEDKRAYPTSFKDVAPPELELLTKQLRRLANLPDWRQVSEDIPDSDITPVAGSTREEIIVQLAAAVEAKAWVIAYGKQNVQLKERISPNSAYYIITADPNIMPAKALLERLRLDEAVLSAQLNRKVEIRE